MVENPFTHIKTTKKELPKHLQNQSYEENFSSPEEKEIPINPFGIKIKTTKDLPDHIKENFDSNPFENEIDPMNQESPFSQKKYSKKQYTVEEQYQYKRKKLIMWGWKKIIENADPSLVFLLYRHVNHTLRSRRILLSPEKLSKDQPFLFRETEEEKAIEKTAQWMEKKFHNKIKPLKLPKGFKIPKFKEFSIPAYAESTKYTNTRIFYDIETDKQSGKPICCGAFNLEARRLVLAIYDPELKEPKIKSFNHNIYVIFTKNLWEGVLLADIETVLGCISLSALMEGHNNLKSLLKELTIIKHIKINGRLYEEILKGIPQRTSIWIAHRSFFDLFMNNYTYKKAKKDITILPKEIKHEKFNLFLGQIIEKTDKIKDKHKLKKIDTYSFVLGNRRAGFRFQVTWRDTKPSYPVVTLAPIQKETYSLVFAMDTNILSFAMQNPKHSLEALSEGTLYPKFKSDYQFSKEDFTNLTNLTKEQIYLFQDLFATCSVYEKLAQELNFAELEKTLDITLQPTNAPRLSRIISSASIAKQALFAYLEKETGLSKYQIQNNIIKIRKHLQNFVLTYAGGRNECLSHGNFYPQPENNLLIFYDDFKALYGSISRTVLVEHQYYLASKGTLHKYLKYDKEFIRKKFWNAVETVISCIKDLKSIPDSILKDFIGTALIKTDIPLLFRDKTEGKVKKRFDGLWIGKIHRHIIDILTAVIRYSLENKISPLALQNKIRFEKVEYLDLKKEVAEYGKEFFTKLSVLRDEKQLEGNSVEKLLKYIITSSYGIAGEGISREDQTGKLFIASIFGTITSGARFLTSIAEIAFRFHNQLPLYTDTDSLVNLCHKEIHNKICSIFQNISELKREKDYGKKIEDIKAVRISKKKKYQFLSKNINTEKIEYIPLENDLFICGKTHGKSQYPTDPFVDTIFNISKSILFERISISSAVEKHYQKHPRFQKHKDFYKEEGSKNKGILKFFHKSQTVKWMVKRKNNAGEIEKTIHSINIPQPNHLIGTIDYLNQYNNIIKINIFYNVITNSFLFTNLEEKPIECQFGIYGNTGNIKIFYGSPYKQKTIEQYFEFENSFLQLIENFLFNTPEKELWQKIALAQMKTINKYLSKSKELFYDSVKENFLKLEEAEEEIQLKDSQLNYRVNKLVKDNKLLQYSKKVFSQVKHNTYKIVPRKNIYIDLSKQTQKLPKLSKKELDILEFTEKYLKEFLKEDGWNYIHITNLSSQDLNYFRSLGANLYKIPNSIHQNSLLEIIWNSEESQATSFLKEKTTKELKTICSSLEIPKFGNKEQIIERILDTISTLKDPDIQTHNENELQYFYEYLIEEMEKEPNKSIYNYVEEHFNLKHSLEEFLNIQTYNESFLRQAHETDPILHSIGFFNFQNFLTKLKKQFFKFKSKTDKKDKLKKYFSYDKSTILREKTKKYNENAWILEPLPKIKEKEDSMTTMEHLAKTVKTDGFSIHYWCHYDPLTFATYIMSNNNQLVTKNLINLARIGSWIYYSTHNKPNQLLKLWDTMENLPCYKGKATVQIPLKFRKLLSHKTIHNRTTYPESEIKYFFSDKEIKTITKQKILKRKKKEYIIKNAEKFIQFYHKILNQCWLLYSPNFHESEFPNKFPKIIKKKWLNSEWSIEILPHDNTEYNSKLYLYFLIGNNNVFKAELHANPNSRNLINIDLFKTSIRELEENEFIISNMIEDLFTYKELSTFNRNASLTTFDMIEKTDYNYLREVFFLTLTHNQLEKALKRSMTKISQISLSDNYKLPDSVNMKELMTCLSQSVVRKFNSTLEKLPAQEQIRLRNQDISCLPHRSSIGVTTNHWKKGTGRIACSVYGKGWEWIINKTSRTMRTRNINMSNSELNEEAWKEGKNILRYEISLWGFKTIYDSSYLNHLVEVRTFINKYVNEYLKAKNILALYFSFLDHLSESVPSIFFNPYFDPQKPALEYPQTQSWLETIDDFWIDNFPT